MTFNSIKRAIISLVKKDDKLFHTTQVSYNGKSADIEIQTPYGFCSVSPKNSLVLMLNIHGQEENRIGFADSPQERFKNLEEYEVQVGNYNTLASIKFNKDKSIDITTLQGVVNINATTININGKLNVVGDTTFTGALTSNGKNISDTHNHAGSPSAPTGGVSNTGGVV